MFDFVGAVLHKAGTIIGSLLISAGSLFVAPPTAPVPELIHNGEFATSFEIQEITEDVIEDPASLMTEPQVRVGTKIEEKTSSSLSSTPTPVPARLSGEWEFVRPYTTVIITAASEDSASILSSWDELTVYSVHEDGILKNKNLSTGDIPRSDAGTAWQRFVDIAGTSFVNEHVDEYMTYDLPDESTLAFVERIGRTDAPWFIYKEASEIERGVSYHEHSTGWGLAVNLGADKQEQVVTLIHEYAHILTLNDDQIEYDMPLIDQFCKKEARISFYIGDSKECPKKKSYMQAFLETFWHKDHAKNGSNFVTQYAATNPVEDIAESFTTFVLQQKPTTIHDIGDEKILFFYQYPELVAIRDRIRASVAGYFN